MAIYLSVRRISEAWLLSTPGTLSIGNQISCTQAMLDSYLWSDFADGEFMLVVGQLM